MLFVWCIYSISRLSPLTLSHTYFLCPCCPLAKRKSLSPISCLPYLTICYFYSLGDWQGGHHTTPLLPKINASLRFFPQHFTIVHIIFNCSSFFRCQLSVCHCNFLVALACISFPQVKQIVHDLCDKIRLWDKQMTWFMGLSLSLSLCLSVYPPVCVSLSFYWLVLFLLGVIPNRPIKNRNEISEYTKLYVRPKRTIYIYIYIHNKNNNNKNNNNKHSRLLTCRPRESAELHMNFRILGLFHRYR